MKDTIFYGALDLPAPQFSAGTWTLTKTGNIHSWDKSAADETPVVSIAVPKFNQGAQFGGRIKSVGIVYSVATAALDAAPSIVLNKLTLNQTTKAVSRAAITDTDTVAGSDTTGTAAGNYTLSAVVADADLVADDENVTYTVEGTFNAAGTTVLKIFGLEVQYA